ncbi:MAG: hypothetical protein COB35_01310 [Gammaproteobacteria bacterium]|nr:MAG: hypothetical protein COB35_01310 [Gammaproteobacteria bacterium]
MEKLIVPQFLKNPQAIRQNFQQVLKLLFGLVVYLVFMSKVFAHDPIFSPGPHVLFKEGIEVHGNVFQAKSGDEKATEFATEFKYGLSGDWVAGVELPYQKRTISDQQFSAVGDISIFTKYRFWRNDTLGRQETAAILAKVKLDTSNNELNSNAVDSIIGLTYGVESIKWYRWASIRQRFNGNINKAQLGNFQRGDITLIDFVIGYRPKLNGYREPDMVYMLELNSEFSQRNKLNGTSLVNSGGKQAFVSPGFMWTLRNMAIKGGVQIPVYSNLNGHQQNSDYRFKLSIEWHL